MNVIEYLITRLLKVFDKEQVYLTTKIKDKKFCYNSVNKYKINFFLEREKLLKRYHDCAKKFDKKLLE